MSRCLVRIPNWLGDAVMALPAVNALLKAHREVSIICHPRVSEVPGIFFPEVPVISGERPQRGRFSKAVLMTGSFRSALEVFLTGIPERIGHTGDLRGPLLTRRVTPRKGRGHHHSLDYMDLAEAGGASASVAVIPAPRVSPSGEEHIAIFPGSRYGQAKVWDDYGRLARSLTDSIDLPVQFYGPGSETDILSRLAQGVRRATVRAGAALSEVSSNLLSAKLAVGNDSGGVHLAAALGVPTLSIFGSTAPEWTSPRGRRTAVISSSVSCSPCFRRACPKGDMECMKSIGVRTVHDAALSLLERLERR